VFVNAAYGWSLKDLFKSVFETPQIESPEYQVLSKNGNLEIRKYPATKWVGTSFRGQVKDVNSNQMFMKLFKYISGDNSQQTKIEMTSPVLMFYQNINNELMTKDSNVDMSMRFYVPKVNQDNTPTPKQSDEFIKTEPEMIVATYRFGGWASISDYMSNRDMLISILGDQAKDYDTYNMITAGYDSPMTWFNRRNEVILKKKVV